MTFILFWIFIYHLAHSQKVIELFRDGKPVKNYDIIVSSLCPYRTKTDLTGTTIEFHMGQGKAHRVKLKSCLGRGKGNAILKIDSTDSMSTARGKSWAIRISSQVNTTDSIDQTLRGYKKLKPLGGSVVEVDLQRSVPGTFAIVEALDITERTGNVYTMESLARSLMSAIQSAAKGDTKKLDEIKSGPEFAAFKKFIADSSVMHSIGDFKFEQILLAKDRWVLADWIDKSEVTTRDRLELLSFRRISAPEGWRSTVRFTPGAHDPHHHPVIGLLKETFQPIDPFVLETLDEDEMVVANDLIHELRNHVFSTRLKKFGPHIRANCWWIFSALKN